MNSARGWLALAVALIAVLGVAFASADSIRTSSLDAMIAVARLSPAALPPPSAPASRRVGRALESPLLLTCAPEGTADGPPGHQGAYWLMQAGIGGARMAVVFDPALSAAGQRAYARDVTDLADCVYRQNAAAFCNPDNRALAIETITMFGRMLDASGDIAPAVKDRLLSAFRNNLQDGRLAAGDFGFFVPKPVLDVVRSTRPLRDACARS